MDASELMLGDWVYVKVGNFKRAVRVTRLSECFVEYNNKSCTMPEHLSGIPLTEELMKKNGYNPRSINCAMEDLVFKYVHELQHFFKLAKFKRDFMV